MCHPSFYKDYEMEERDQFGPGSRYQYGKKCLCVWIPHPKCMREMFVETVYTNE